MAFYGCEEEKFVFEGKDLQSYSVPNDAFVCGYLLHQFDLNLDCLMAEFPHMSIQEYFAALHCYQLMIKEGIPNKTGVIGEIMESHSLFGRFVLGIASANGHFLPMVDWITQPRIYGGTPASLGRLANHFLDQSADDWSLAERQILEDKLESIISVLAEEFGHEQQAGEFHEIVVLKGEGAVPDKFYVSSDTPRKAEFGYVKGLPSLELTQKFDSIGILNCTVDRNQFEELISRVDLFPSRIWSFFLELEGQNLFEACLSFQYIEQTFPALQMFSFSFPKGEILDIPQLSINKKLISRLDTEKREDSKLVAMVTLNYSVPFSSLLKSAIPLVLQLYHEFDQIS